MIYFVETADRRAVKIGYTGQSMNLRLRGLAKEYGSEFHLLGTIEGTRRDEKALHRRFASSRRFERARSSYRRELFDPTPDLMQLIASGTNRLDTQGDVTVKMDAEVVRKAKIVAAYRGQSLAEFLSVTLGESVDGLLEIEHAKETKSTKPKGGRS